MSGRYYLFWFGSFDLFLRLQVSVVINAWYGPLYNDIQTALTGDGGITVIIWYFSILYYRFSLYLFT